VTHALVNRGVAKVKLGDGRGAVADLTAVVSWPGAEGASG